MIDWLIGWFNEWFASWLIDWLHVLGWLGLFHCRIRMFDRDRSGTIDIHGPFIDSIFGLHILTLKCVVTYLQNFRRFGSTSATGVRASIDSTVTAAEQSALPVRTVTKLYLLRTSWPFNDLQYSFSCCSRIILINPMSHGGFLFVAELAEALTSFGYRLSPQFFSTIVRTYASRRSTGKATEDTINFDDFIEACVTVKVGNFFWKFSENFLKIFWIFFETFL